MALGPDSHPAGTVFLRERQVYVNSLHGVLRRMSFLRGVNAGDEIILRNCRFVTKNKVNIYYSAGTVRSCAMIGSLE